MDIEEKLRALAKAAAALNGAGVVYGVGASAMLYLRGIVEDFNDVDLTVAEPDAPRAIAALEALGTMVPPEQRPDYLTRCFREFEIDGVEVDLIAGMVIVSDDGAAHECPLRREDIDETVSVRGVPVPLHALACWQRYYARMGRKEKAALVERAIRERRTEMTTTEKAGF